MGLFRVYLFGCQIVNIRNVSENTPKVCFIQLVFIALQSLKLKDMIVKTKILSYSPLSVRVAETPRTLLLMRRTPKQGVFYLFLKLKDYDYKG